METSPGQARQICDEILGYSVADDCSIQFSSSETEHQRFALNQGTTNGASDDFALTISSRFGQRTGTVSLHQFSTDQLKEAVRQSEKIAKLAPANPESMPLPEAQKYLSGTNFDPATSRMTSSELAGMVFPSLAESRQKNVVSAGYLEKRRVSQGRSNNRGLFASNDATSLLYSITSRTAAGNGSGWAGTTAHAKSLINTSSLGSRAIDKCLRSQNPVRLEPGDYTVVLEPAAVMALLIPFLTGFDARSADEGRSFLSDRTAGTKLEQKLVGSNISVYSDPTDPIAPSITFDTDGLPLKKMAWLAEGTVRNLIYSRFWAEKQKREPVPRPENIIMTGGTASTEDLIQSVKRGLLVTHFWYVRSVDPQQMLLTGLTRDGTFLIENGRITSPVNNFRFNESPVRMLNEVEALGRTERATDIEYAVFPVSIPPLLVRKFRFSSVSDSV